MSEHTCPYCGVGIDGVEDALACPACSIVFHKECWFQNMGCATYGCKHVGCLKPAPEKINVPNAPGISRMPYRGKQKEKNFLEETPLWHCVLLLGCVLSFIPTVVFGLWPIQLIILVVLLVITAIVENKIVLLLSCLVVLWTTMVSGCFSCIDKSGDDFDSRADEKNPGVYAEFSPESPKTSPGLTG